MGFVYLLLHPIQAFQAYRFRRSTQNDISNELDVYKHLKNTSRSFYLVIMQLEGELQISIAYFYVMLRMLDTFEDEIPVHAQSMYLMYDFVTYFGKEDIEEMNAFIHDNTTIINEFVENPHERELFHAMPDLFRHYLETVSKELRTIICDCMQVMVDGMMTFNNADIQTKDDLDKYCYHVAGVVGENLTKIYHKCMSPTKHISNDLSVHCGLFLQKTNLIRDVYKDIQEDRMFWPRELFSELLHIDNEVDLADNPGRVFILNEMVRNTVHQHFDHVLVYLSLIEDSSYFKFVAIPQIMALQTLLLVYDNPLTFVEKVRIPSRILTGSLSFHCSDYGAFERKAQSLLQKFDFYD
ncbi:hypothetical protein PCE1_002110 [Barthelona sp. PCE]